MSTIAPRRLWTTEEDEQLRLLVSYWGDQCGKSGNWDKISADFEHRSPKDCRKRWFHSLDPKLKRGRWSESEDKVLVDAFKRLGPSWQRISQLIPGRTDDQCSKRYNDVLSPTASERLRDWEPAEDEKLIALIDQYGTRWREICKHMEGRTGLTCRNRWRKLKKAEEARGRITDDMQEISYSQKEPSPPPAVQSVPRVDNHPPPHPPHLGSQMHIDGPRPHVSSSAHVSSTNAAPGAPLPSSTSTSVRGGASAHIAPPPGGVSEVVHYTFNYDNADTYDRATSSAPSRQTPLAEPDLLRILEFCRNNNQKIVIHQHIYPSPLSAPQQPLPPQPREQRLTPSIDLGSPQADDLFMGVGTFGSMDYLAFNPS